MKKILTFAAIALVAVAAQAATIGWAAASMSNAANNAYQMFVVGQNGVTDSAQIAGFIANGDDVSSYAFGSGNVLGNGRVSSSATAAGAPSLPSLGSENDKYTAFIVVYDKPTIDKATKFAVTGTAQVGFASTAGTANFAFGDQSAAVADGKWTSISSGPIDVPEPTSLALIALGVAAFGLKRKHA